MSDIPALRFSEAKELVAAQGKFSARTKEDLEPEEERLPCELIKEKTGSEFVFVTHYPAAKRPFYAMEEAGEPQEDYKVTSSFDLLFRGMEITTGGQRIHSYEEQIRKMEERGRDISQFESYLLMHKYGMPHHGGMGLGLERFTSRLLEQENVRRACLFPRDINRVEP